MPATSSFQRLSFVFLCSGPFLVVALVGIRALRVPGVYQVIGTVVFAMFAIATWMLASKGIRSQLPEMRLAALAGTLLVLPFALIGLFWVGARSALAGEPS